jgi:hypothetical protein
MKWEYIFNSFTIGLVIVIVITIIIVCCSKKDKKALNLFGKIADQYKSTSVINPVKKRLNKYEEECRRIFQEIFNSPFPSTRPDWLKNPNTKKNLELDGFNPNVPTSLGRGLAFEYDGKQHSEYTPKFHKSYEDFHYQQLKDEWKDRKCLERKVLLIRIPCTVKFINLGKFIKEKLMENDIQM